MSCSGPTSTQVHVCKSCLTTRKGVTTCTWHVIGAGDYDYDDCHDVPAGCQFQAAPLQESTLSGAGANSHVVAPAPVPSKAAIAEAVPLQSPAPAMHVSGGTNDSYIAPAPAPERAPGNGTLVIATQAAALDTADNDKPAQGKLLCKPIAARGEPARPLSTAAVAGIAVGAAVALLILMCCVCRPSFEYTYENNGLTTRQAWEFKCSPLWGWSKKKSSPAPDTDIKG